jgi:hypothetical protein
MQMPVIIKIVMFLLDMIRLSAKETERREEKKIMPTDSPTYISHTLVASD